MKVVPAGIMGELEKLSISKLQLLSSKHRSVGVARKMSYGVQQPNQGSSRLNLVIMTSGRESKRFSWGPQVLMVSILRFGRLFGGLKFPKSLKFSFRKCF